MPAPIVRIPVDDAAFKRFVDTFNKYQTQLKAQPEVWKDVSDSIGVAVAAGASFAAEIAHQAEETRRLTAEERSREVARQEAARRRKEEAAETEKREREAIERRKASINQVREFGRTVFDTAQTVAKWGLGLATLPFGGLWGLTSMVSGVANDRRSAMGVGVSMGQRQGMGVQMQRYFDVNSVLENVANAQANPSQWGAFRVMGVNPQGDTADTAYQIARAARRMFIADKGNLALAGAQGLTQFFTPDDLRRMAGESDRQFNASINQSRAYRGLSDDVGLKWQNFMINLDMAGKKLENTLVNKLTILERNGTLDRIIQKFGDLAIRVLDRIDFDKLGRGLDEFGQKISSGEFQKNFDTIISDFARLAHVLEVIGNHIPSWMFTKDAAVGAAAGAGVGVLGGPLGIAGGAVVGGIVGGAMGQAKRDVEGAASAVGKWASSLFGGSSNGSLADRNNNPGNIMQGGRYGRYATPEAGWTAMARQLLIDYDRHKQQTVRSLINDPRHGWSNQWAPGNSAQATGNYMSYVASKLHVGIDDRLNLHDANTLKTLMVAMNEFERGARRREVAQKSGRTGTSVTIKNHTGGSVVTTTNALAGG